MTQIIHKHTEASNCKHSLVDIYILVFHCYGDPCRLASSLLHRPLHLLVVCGYIDTRPRQASMARWNTSICSVFRGDATRIAAHKNETKILQHGPIDVVCILFSALNLQPTCWVSTTNCTNIQFNSPLCCLRSCTSLSKIHLGNTRT